MDASHPTAQSACLSGSFLEGSLPIRAPPTLDEEEEEEDSDVEPKPPRINSKYSSTWSEYGYSDSGSDSEGFADCVAHSETASERAFVGYPDYQKVDKDGEISKHQFFRPSVAYPNERRTKSDSDVEECSSVAESMVVDDESDVRVHRVIPIARLSTDFEEEEEDDEMIVNEDSEDKGIVVGTARIPSSSAADELETGECVPRIRAVVDEEWREEEVESMNLMHCSFEEEALPINDSTKDSVSAETSECTQVGLEILPNCRGGGVGDVQEEVNWSNEKEALKLKNVKLAPDFDADFTKKCNSNMVLEAVPINVLKLDLDKREVEPCSSYGVKVPLSLENGEEFGAYFISLTPEEDVNGSWGIGFDNLGPGITFKHVKRTTKADVLSALPQANASQEANVMNAVSFEAKETALLNEESMVAISYSGKELESEGRNGVSDAFNEMQGGEKSSICDEDFNESILSELEDKFTCSLLLDSENSQTYSAKTVTDMVAESNEDPDTFVHDQRKVLLDLDILSALLTVASSTGSEENLSENKKQQLEKTGLWGVTFLRLVHRLGYSLEENMVAQVLYQLALTAGASGCSNPGLFPLGLAKQSASLLEADCENINLSMNILVIGKTGVGKSATINSILQEKKATVDAFKPATAAVEMILGKIHGINIRFIDTPGLRSSGSEEALNRRILGSIKKFTNRFPPDVVLYVDRLDGLASDFFDLPLLQSITTSLGSSIWCKAIFVLTHALSNPPDGPTGLPLSYDVLASQQSREIQWCIGRATGDARLMNPNLMLPLSLVENRPCESDKNKCDIFPGVQSWRPRLLFMCCALKVLSEATRVSKPQESFNPGRRRNGCQENNYTTETRDEEYDGAVTSSVHEPDMVLPPAFHGGDPAYTCWISDASFPLLFRQVLHPNVSDHCYGYEGTNIDSTLDVCDRLLSKFAVGISEHKPNSNIRFDSSVRRMSAASWNAIGRLVCSLMSHRNDISLSADLESRFSIGRGSTVSVFVRLNDKQSGKIALTTSSSEHPRLALLGLLPMLVSIFRTFFPEFSTKNSR